MKSRNTVEKSDPVHDSATALSEADLKANLAKFLKKSTQDIYAKTKSKVYTDQDLDTQTHGHQQCLLKIPIKTYGIENIAMEYNWNIQGI